MRLWHNLALTLTALCIATTAFAATPSQFDPRQHRQFAGQASQVMVLGTPHLANLPERFTNDQLAPLLDRLAAWKPDIITIEALSGRQCAELRAYAPIHPDAAETYCLDPAEAGAIAGMDVATATIAAEKALADWPRSPSAADRRHLAALFLTGGNYASALVQWLRLSASERRAGDDLNDQMVAFLGKREASRNENYSVAAALAARLGLERVYPVDDHTADNTAWQDQGYQPAFDRIWSGPALKARKAAEQALEDKLGQPGAVLAMYRAYNDPSEAKAAFDTDFGAALADDTPPKQFGREYVGWWETRNLRMVANIRAALTMHPGARVLSIVGASHKGYFEAYLEMMHDIQLFDSRIVLR